VDIIVNLLVLTREFLFPGALSRVCGADTECSPLIGRGEKIKLKSKEVYEGGRSSPPRALIRPIPPKGRKVKILFSFALFFSVS
jgi:hypothetical protein